MRFAVSLPWWGYVAIAAACLGAAWFTYAAARVDTRTRAGLTALRALVLLLLAAAVLRPVQVVAPLGARDRIVAILVDVSRSMRIADAQGPGAVVTTDDGLAALAAADPWFAALRAAPPRALPRAHVHAGVPLALVELTGRAGDLLLMDPRLLHTVSANRGDRPRLVMRLTACRA